MGESNLQGRQVTATPGETFLRSVSDVLRSERNALAGWALNGATRSVFYSGDTALHPGFKEIGERLGPFDLTLMEYTGAYNSLWPDVHLARTAALAHQLVLRQGDDALALGAVRSRLTWLD